MQEVIVHGGVGRDGPPLFSIQPEGSQGLLNLEVNTHKLVFV